MATFTIWAKSALMNVVPVMARDACVWRFAWVCVALLVASFALQINVGSGEGVSRLRVMIEGPALPVNWVVTSLTIGSQSPLVFVAL